MRAYLVGATALICATAAFGDPSSPPPRHGVLEKIEISNPKFSIDRGRFEDEAVLSFTISNRSPVAIKTIRFSGRLQTVGRSVPWIEDDFAYDISGGIEPGETKKMDLVPNSFSEWRKLPKEAKGASLTVVLKSIVAADGSKISD